MENGKIVISLNSCNIQNRKQSSYSKSLNNSEHFSCFEFFNLKSNSKVIDSFTNRGLGFENRGNNIISFINWRGSVQKVQRSRSRNFSHREGSEPERLTSGTGC